MEATDALRAGKCVQKAGQPLSWCYVKMVGNEPRWFGFGDSWDQHHHFSGGSDYEWVEVDEAEARARRPAGTHKCGRRGEGLHGATRVELPDHYSVRNGNERPACSYCGSISGDDFMAGVEDGSIVVGVTDKNYKAYVCRRLSFDEVAKAKEDWKKIGVGQAMLERGEQDYEDWFASECVNGMFSSRQVCKFYYQHLSDAQMQRFIELYNDKKIKFGYPGGFTRLPYFMKPA